MTHRLTAFVVAMTGLTVPAAIVDGEAPDDRPAYHSVLRQAEDWRGLSGDGIEGTDPFDPIKYIPLTEDESTWISFGGQQRLRAEAWNNFGFGTDDGAFILNRLRLHGDLHVGENARVFVEGKSALATDRDLPGGQRTLDVDSAALQQAFAEYRFDLAAESSVRVRAGRQMLSFGSQRLVSPLDWSNTMRAWDGVKATFTTDGFEAKGFWTQFAPVDKYDFNEPDEDTQFGGLYATADLGVTDADFYWLVLDGGPATFNQTTGEQTRHTVGTRLFGDIEETGFSYDLETAYQFGEVGPGDVSAYMAGAELSYTFDRNDSTSPRVHLGLDYGSGDDAPGGDVETFNQLFPLGHAYLGYIDAVGRQNVIDLSGGITIEPIDRLTLKGTGHAFWRADRDDAVYNAGGGVLRAGNLGNSLEVGQEIDLTAKYQFDRHLSGLVGYSHFFAGSFIEESGSADDIDFFYTQLQFTF